MSKHTHWRPWPVALLYLLWRLALIGWVIISTPAQIALSTGDRYDPTRSWPTYLTWWQGSTIVLVALTLMGTSVAVARGIAAWRQGRHP